MTTGSEPTTEITVDVEQPAEAVNKSPSLPRAFHANADALCQIRCWASCDTRAGMRDGWRRKSWTTATRRTLSAWRIACDPVVMDERIDDSVNEMLGFLLVLPLRGKISRTMLYCQSHWLGIKRRPPCEVSIDRTRVSCSSTTCITLQMISFAIPAKQVPRSHATKNE